MKPKTLIFIVYTFLNQVSYACSCFPVTLKENVRKSDVIFIGTVIDIDTLNVVPVTFITSNVFNYDTVCAYGFDRLITIKTIRYFKGRARTDTIQIATGVGGGDCGYDFDLNKKYVIYARIQVYNIIEDLKNKQNIVYKTLLTTTEGDRTTDLIAREQRILQIAFGKRYIMR